jgi:glutamine synthetase
MADGYATLSDKIEGGMEVRDAVAELLQENFQVIFNGDGYSDEWVVEAEKRGLKNLNNATKALSTLDSDKNKKIFDAAKVLKPQELEARKDVLLGEVANTILIEAKTALRMVETGYMPAFASDLKGYIDVGLNSDSRQQTYQSVQDNAASLSQAISAYTNTSTTTGQGEYSSDTLRPVMSTLRESVDEGESLCEENLLPYSGYQNILFDHQSE